MGDYRREEEVPRNREKDEDKLGKYDVKKFEKTHWVTSEMGKKYERDIFLVINARETVFYVLFVICVTIVAIGSIGNRTFFMSQSIKDHLKNQAGEPIDPFQVPCDVKFDKISTVSEMWDFIEQHLIRYLHTHPNVEGNNESTNINNETNENSTIMSNPFKKRQNDEEEISDKSEEEGVTIEESAFEHSYRSTQADQRRILDVIGEQRTGPANGNTTAEEIQISGDRGLGYENHLVGTPTIRSVAVNARNCSKPFPAVFRRCYPPYDSDAATTNDSLPWLYRPATETLAESFLGTVTRYRGDGFSQNLGLKYEDSKRIVGRLKNERFVVSGTRAIFIDAFYYNPNVNLFCAVKFLFELPASGGVIPSAYFYSLRFPRRMTTGDFVVLAFEIVTALFVTFYLVEAVRTIVEVKWDYLRCFWNYVDVAILASFLTYLIVSFIHDFEANSVLKQLRSDVAAPIGFQTLCVTELMLRSAIGVLVALVFLKLFKFMSFNRTMTTLNHAFKLCFSDILAFLGMFLIILVAFALLGTILFGFRVIYFSTVSSAMFALLRVILGDFYYKEFDDSDEYIAPIYCVLYIFFMFFILMNLILAVINDTYNDAKTDLITSSKKRSADFWNLGIYNFCLSIGCKSCAPKNLISDRPENPAVNELKATFKRNGYTDSEIDLYLGRHNVDPEAQIRVKDVSRITERHRLHAPKRYFPKARFDEEGTYVPPIIAMEDFKQQRNRLMNVESVMNTVSARIDSLLEKLTEYESQRK